MNSIVKNAVLNAVLTALYVALIASFLFYGPKAFGQKADTVLVPIVMLLLLVLSAAITGTLVFGRPLLWYVDGKKKEAVSLLIYTLISLLIIIIGAFCALYFFIT